MRSDGRKDGGADNVKDTSFRLQQGTIKSNQRAVK